MATPPEHPPEHRGKPDPRRGPPRGWRVATPVVGVVAGLMLAISAVDSQGTDLRPGRYADMASLVQKESNDYDALSDERRDLQREARGLAQSVDTFGVRKLRREIARLQDPAGMVPREGPGVTVVLSDSPQDVLDQAADAGYDRLRDLVVHQQDIQAVVNAMWVGGALAVTIEGQRIISTTGIRCEGNAVQLKGVPYAQPYEIQAVGDPVAIEAALLADSGVQAFIASSEDPEVAVGWEMRAEDNVEAPAFDGSLGIDYATPITPAK